VNRTKISFAGSGALASGLARLLHAQGYAIGEIVSREAPASRRRAASLAHKVGAKAVAWSAASLDCDILWLAVPDGEIEKLARQLAGRRQLPAIVLHPSGALSSAVLAPLSRRGVHTASAHPMMTFVAGEPPSLKGACFAVEGDAVALRKARETARKLGARCFAIDPANKALYHAFGSMLSPMLVAELAAAEQVGLAAGVPKAEVRRVMEPIVRRTIGNALRSGAAASLSGPLVRGDLATIAAHLKALGRTPESRVYRALTEYAAEVLPVKRPEETKKLLRRRSRTISH
jgi:predicted short-subunit dehydrogenase-like oxidoreductase (DUF2520 family)